MALVGLLLRGHMTKGDRAENIAIFMETLLATTCKGEWLQGHQEKVPWGETMASLCSSSGNNETPSSGLEGRRYKDAEARTQVFMVSLLTGFFRDEFTEVSR